MIGNIIEAAFDRPGYEDQARLFCAKIVAALKDFRIYASDLDEIIAALTKTFPVVVLDMLVEQTVDGTGRTLFQDIRSNSNCGCSLDVIPEDVWMAWAAQKPETRYELLARVIRFSSAGEDDPANGWSSAASKLIDNAPEPVKILDTFLQRFKPSGWSGSLADILVTRMRLIDVLIEHSNPVIVAWANEHSIKYKSYIDRQRALESAENRTQDQAFE